MVRKWAKVKLFFPKSEYGLRVAWGKHFSVINATLCYMATIQELHQNIPHQCGRGLGFGVEDEVQAKIGLRCRWRKSSFAKGRPPLPPTSSIGGTCDSQATGGSKNARSPENNIAQNHLGGVPDGPTSPTTWSNMAPRWANIAPTCPA